MKMLVLCSAIFFGGCSSREEVAKYDAVTDGTKMAPAVRYTTPWAPDLFLATIEGHKYIATGRGGITHALSCPCLVSRTEAQGTTNYFVIHSFQDTRLGIRGSRNVNDTNWTLYYHDRATRTNVPPEEAEAIWMEEWKGVSR